MSHSNNKAIKDQGVGSKPAGTSTRAASRSRSPSVNRDGDIDSPAMPTVLPTDPKSVLPSSSAIVLPNTVGSRSTDAPGILELRQLHAEGKGPMNHTSDPEIVSAAIDSTGSAFSSTGDIRSATLTTGSTANDSTTVSNRVRTGEVKSNSLSLTPTVLAGISPSLGAGSAEIFGTSGSDQQVGEARGNPVGTRAPVASVKATGFMSEKLSDVDAEGSLKRSNAIQGKGTSSVSSFGASYVGSGNDAPSSERILTMDAFESGGSPERKRHSTLERSRTASINNHWEEERERDRERRERTLQQQSQVTSAMQSGSLIFEEGRSNSSSPASETNNLSLAVSSATASQAGDPGVTMETVQSVVRVTMAQNALAAEAATQQAIGLALERVVGPLMERIAALTRFMETRPAPGEVSYLQSAASTSTASNSGNAEVGGMARYWTTDQRREEQCVTTHRVDRESPQSSSPTRPPLPPIRQASTVELQQQPQLQFPSRHDDEVEVDYEEDYDDGKDEFIGTDNGDETPDENMNENQDLYDGCDDKDVEFLRIEQLPLEKLLEEQRECERRHAELVREVALAREARPAHVRSIQWTSAQRERMQEELTTEHLRADKNRQYAAKMNPLTIPFPEEVLSREDKAARKVRLRGEEEDEWQASIEGMNEDRVIRQFGRKSEEHKFFELQRQRAKKAISDKEKTEKYTAKQRAVLCASASSSASSSSAAAPTTGKRKTPQGVCVPSKSVMDGYQLSSLASTGSFPSQSQSRAVVVSQQQADRVSRPSSHASSSVSNIPMAKGTKKRSQPSGDSSESDSDSDSDDKPSGSRRSSSGKASDRYVNIHKQWRVMVSTNSLSKVEAVIDGLFHQELDAMYEKARQMRDYRVKYNSDQTLLLKEYAKFGVTYELPYPPLCIREFQAELFAHYFVIKESVSLSPHMNPGNGVVASRPIVATASKPLNFLVEGTLSRGGSDSFVIVQDICVIGHLKVGARDQESTIATFTNHFNEYYWDDTLATDITAPLGFLSQVNNHIGALRIESSIIAGCEVFHANGYGSDYDRTLYYIALMQYTVDVVIEIALYFENQRELIYTLRRIRTFLTFHTALIRVHEFEGYVVSAAEKKAEIEQILSDITSASVEDYVHSRAFDKNISLERARYMRVLLHHLYALGHGESLGSSWVEPSGEVSDEVSVFGSLLDNAAFRHQFFILRAFNPRNAAASDMDIYCYVETLFEAGWKLTPGVKMPEWLLDDFQPPFKQPPPPPPPSGGGAGGGSRDSQTRYGRHSVQTNFLDAAKNNNSSSSSSQDNKRHRQAHLRNIEPEQDYDITSLYDSEVDSNASSDPVLVPPANIIPSLQAELASLRLQLAQRQPSPSPPLSDAAQLQSLIERMAQSGLGVTTPKLEGKGDPPVKPSRSGDYDSDSDHGRPKPRFNSSDPPFKVTVINPDDDVRGAAPVNFSNRHSLITYDQSDGKFTQGIHIIYKWDYNRHMRLSSRDRFRWSFDKVKKFDNKDQLWTIDVHLNYMLDYAETNNIPHHTLGRALITGDSFTAEIGAAVSAERTLFRESSERASPSMEYIHWNNPDELDFTLARTYLMKVLIYFLRKYRKFPKQVALLAMLQNVKLKTKDLSGLRACFLEIQSIWNKQDCAAKRDTALIASHLENAVQSQGPLVWQQYQIEMANIKMDGIFEKFTDQLTYLDKCTDQIETKRLADDSSSLRPQAQAMKQHSQRVRSSSRVEELDTSDDEWVNMKAAHFNPGQSNNSGQRSSNVYGSNPPSNNNHQSQRPPHVQQYSKSQEFSPRNNQRPQQQQSRGDNRQATSSQPFGMQRSSNNLSNTNQLQRRDSGFNNNRDRSDSRGRSDNLPARKTTFATPSRTDVFRCIICGYPSHEADTCVLSTEGFSISIPATAANQHASGRVRHMRRYGMLSRLPTAEYARFCNLVDVARAKLTLPRLTQDAHDAIPDREPTNLISSNGIQYALLPEGTRLLRDPNSTILNTRLPPYTDRPGRNVSKLTTPLSQGTGGGGPTSRRNPMMRSDSQPARNNAISVNWDSSVRSRSQDVRMNATKVSSMVFDQLALMQNSVQSSQIPTCHHPRRVSNEHLVYLPITIRAMATAELDLDQRAYLYAGNTPLDQFDSTGGDLDSKRPTIITQADNGAATSCCNATLPIQLGAHIYERKELLGMCGYDGNQTSVTQYAVFMIEFVGLDEDNKPATFMSTIHAQIVPSCAAPFMLGSDAYRDLDITSNNVVRMLYLFANDPKRRLRIPFAKHSDVMDQMAKMAAGIVTPTHLLHRPRLTTGATSATHSKILDKVASDALTFLNSVIEPHTVYMACGLLMLADLYKLDGFETVIADLRALLFKDGCTTPNRAMNFPLTRYVGKLITDEDLVEIIQGLALVLRPLIDDHIYEKKVSTTNSVKLAVNAMVISASEALATATREVGHWISVTAKTPMLSARPPAFPSDLWPLVDDNVKPLVAARFAKYAPERLAQALNLIAKIKIDDSSPSRALEAPIFRAQCIANIDCFAYPDPDNPPQCTDEEMRIQLVDPPPAPAKCHPRRTSEMERAFLKWQIEFMVSKKQLEPSTSSWNQPILCVPFPDRIKAFTDEHGDNTCIAMWDPKYKDIVRRLFRCTLDLRYLNNHTVLEPFPMPLITDILDQCVNKTRYSASDLEDAFHSVRLAEESRPLTAFSTPDGHWQYTVCTMGAKNSANVFARVAHTTFNPFIPRSKLTVYQDDTLNHDSESLASHLDTQQKTYDCLRVRHLNLKPDKTTINFPAQKVLGHIISCDGRRVDPAVVEAITLLRPPTTISGVRSLLGLAQTAREYIPGLAAIVAPIQELTKAVAKTKGGTLVKWIPETHGVAFERLKAILTTAPVLLLPNPTRPYTVHIDACKVGRGFGAILLQLDDAEPPRLHPVAYWSHGLNAAERNYSATGLECTAMHDAILHWRVYLQNGIPFTVVTDHYALCYLVTKIGGDATGRLARLCLDLQSFSFSIKHRAGIEFLDADAVSRLLRIDDNIYIRTEDDLRNDFLPLTQTEMDWLNESYPSDPSQFHLGKFLSDTINKHRLDSRTNIDTMAASAEDNDASLTHTVQQNSTAISAASSTLIQAEEHIDFLDREGSWSQYKWNAQSGLRQSDAVPSSVSFDEDDDAVSGWPSTTTWTDTADEYIDQIVRVPSSQPRSYLRMNNATVIPADTLLMHTLRHQAILDARAAKDRAQATEEQVKAAHAKLATQAKAEKIQRLFREANPTLFPAAAEPTETTTPTPISLPSLTPKQKQTSRVISKKLLRAASRITDILGATPVPSSSSERTDIRPSDLVSLIEDALVTTDVSPERQVVDNTTAEPIGNNNPEEPALLTLDAPSTGIAQAIGPVELIVPPTTLSSRTRLVSTKDRDDIAWSWLDEALDRKLCDFDHLHQRTYQHPTDGTLFEVVSVFSRDNVYFSIARILDAQLPDSPVDASMCETRNLQGRQGTIQLIAKYAEVADPTAEPWPTTQQDYIENQSRDPDLAALLARFEADPTLRLPVKHHPSSDGSDYFFRPILHDKTLGALTRQFNKKHKYIHGGGTYILEQATLQTVIPRHLVPLCLRFHHDHMGHPGRERTNQIIMQRFYWPTMLADIKEMVAKCAYCKRRKANNRVPSVPIQEYTPTPRPMSRTHIDLTGPFPLTARGNRYISAFKDATTKYLLLGALPDKTAASVKKLLTSDVIHTLGLPEVFISDCGKEFKNKDMLQLCEFLSIQKQFTTPYNPRADGLVENQMRTLKDTLAYYVNQFQDDWDLYLTLIQYHYNTTVNDATGFTPFFLMFGREAKSGTEEFETKAIKGGLGTFATNMSRAQQHAWQMTAGRMTRNNATHNRQQHPPRAPLVFKPYKVNDWFFLKVVPRRSFRLAHEKTAHTLSSKLQLRYAGPYVITKVVNPVLYEALIHNKRKRVHAINMKPA